jgi:Cd2+/Zn2+-exporting ATPase
VGSVKKEFILEGLGCANCAAKMEHKISKLNGISNANVNFATKTLVIDIDEIDRVDELVAVAKEIVVNTESHVVVREKKNVKTQRVVNDEAHEHDHCEDEHCAHDHNHAHEHKHSHEEDNHHTHEHGHGHGGEEDKGKYMELAIGVAAFLIVTILKLPKNIELILYIASYILIGGEVVLRAIKNIARGEVFDENFLMVLATIGAFAIGEYPEGVAVMLFYQIGELFQDMAVNRSRKSISKLMDIRPDFANIIIQGKELKVSPEEVKIGDVILVKPGEKVPLDGKILEGNSMLDTSALTGESVPREVSTGDEVLSGSINKNGVLTIEVMKSFGESTVAKILELVENASSKKAPTENFITKFARYYTPVVVISAAALAFLPPLFIQGATFSQWIYRALIFLVVSCPCALVISIPLGFFGGIGGASRNGVLVKGGNYLEALNNVETVVFDKTGTLTKGVFKVIEVITSNHYSKDEVLQYAAYAESYSNHPIAISIMKAYGKEVDKKDIEDYNELSGHGIKVKIKGKAVLVGNQKLMEKEAVKVNGGITNGTILHVAIDKIYAGYVLINDEIKEDSAKAIKNLKSLGVKNIVMLTGDNKKVADQVGAQLDIDEIYSELLPDKKVEKIEELDAKKSPNGKIVFVGDGINDAPVLARADIGIAMGGVGSDAAIEAADIVIMTDELSKIVTAIKIAKKTNSIVVQNIVFALSVKGIILVMGAFGIATMWEAVFGDVGVALIAVLNSMRAMETNNK